jgi:hypothetical protein
MPDDDRLVVATRVFCRQAWEGTKAELDDAERALRRCFLYSRGYGHERIDDAIEYLLSLRMPPEEFMNDEDIMAALNMIIWHSQEHI